MQLYSKPNNVTLKRHYNRISQLIEINKYIQVIEQVIIIDKIKIKRCSTKQLSIQAYNFKRKKENIVCLHFNDSIFKDINILHKLLNKEHLIYTTAGP